MPRTSARASSRTFPVPRCRHTQGSWDSWTHPGEPSGCSYLRGPLPLQTDVSIRSNFTCELVSHQALTQDMSRGYSCRSPVPELKQSKGRPHRQPHQHSPSVPATEAPTALPDPPHVRSYRRPVLVHIVAVSTEVDAVVLRVLWKQIKDLGIDAQVGDGIPVEDHQKDFTRCVPAYAVRLNM